MKVWAYVFITTRQPRKVVQTIRRIPGVAKADALFGSPNAIAAVGAHAGGPAMHVKLWSEQNDAVITIPR